VHADRYTVTVVVHGDVGFTLLGVLGLSVLMFGAWWRRRASTQEEVI